MMPLGRRSTAAVLLVAAAGTTGASEERDEGSWLRKGRTALALVANVGVADGDHARHLESLGLSFHRVLSQPRGPGFLRGQLSLAVELVPLFLITHEATTYGAGFNLLGRHYLARLGPARPFVSLGAGLLVSSKELPADSTRVNFTPQLGFGLQFSDRARRHYALEFRLHHISNGGRVDPNPGINSALVLFAVAFAGPE